LQHLVDDEKFRHSTIRKMTAQSSTFFQPWSRVLRTKAKGKRQKL